MFVAVAVHLTLLPALMIICGTHLYHLPRKLVGCEGFASCSCRDSDTEQGLETLLRPSEEGAEVGSTTEVSRYDSTEVSRRWVRLGEFCRDNRNAIIGTMMGVMIPFGYSTLQYQTSISGLMLTPRETPALIAMENITGTSWTMPFLPLQGCTTIFLTIFV